MDTATIAIIVSVLVPSIGAFIGILLKFNSNLASTRADIKKLEESNIHIEKKVDDNNVTIEETQKDLAEFKLRTSDNKADFVSARVFARFVEQQREREEKLQRFLGKIELLLERMKDKI